MPKISVIIPVYNTGKYLSECLDSVINQTFEDIEIICINDGSTDNSQSILDKYAKQDKRIILLKQKNMGVSSARNLGIEYSKSEYIYPLDSDDVILPNTLKILYNAMLADKGDIITCRVKYFGMKSGEMILKKPSKYNMAFENCLVNAGLFRKSDFLLTGGYRNTELEDYDLWLNMIFNHNKKIYRVPEFLFYYRIKGKGDSRNQSRNLNYEYIMNELHNMYSGVKKWWIINKLTRPVRIFLRLFNTFKQIYASLMVNNYLFYKFTFWLKKELIVVRSIRISKRVRLRWKRIQMERLVDLCVSSLKWGVSYSVFDGEELLEASIKSVRKEVDYVNVVYQKNSWYGNPCSPGLLSLLKSLQQIGLIDELVEYEPNYKLKAQKQELIKRNIGLKYAKKSGCNYFMTMDTDEFYLMNQLQYIKKFIVKNKITHSYCPIVNYSSPTRRSLEPGKCFVQFFSRIVWTSKLRNNKHVVALVDPTRQLSHFLCAKYFVLPQLEMHHMIAVRKDLLKKFMNSSFGVIRKFKKSAYIHELEQNSVDVPDVFCLTKNSK